MPPTTSQPSGQTASIGHASPVAHGNNSVVVDSYASGHTQEAVDSLESLDSYASGESLEQPPALTNSTARPNPYQAESIPKSATGSENLGYSPASAPLAQTLSSWHQKDRGIGVSGLKTLGLTPKIIAAVTATIMIGAVGILGLFAGRGGDNPNNSTAPEASKTTGATSLSEGPNPADMIYTINTGKFEVIGSANFQENASFVDGLSLQGNLSVVGDGTFTGNITAANFIGDGSGLTGLPVNGARGATGPRGIAGSDGATGPAGPSTPAICPNGACLSLQASTPGVAETGNINISGNGLFGGSVGIGTSSPGTRLHVFDSSAETFATVENASSAYLRLLTTGQKDFRLRNNGSRFDIIDASSGVNIERLTVDGSGNVGIGTISPGARLHVEDANYPVIRSVRSTSDATGFRGAIEVVHKTSAEMVDGFGSVVIFSLQDPTSPVNNTVASLGAVRDGADNSGALIFNTILAGSLSERLRISAAGNVGIGTTSPQGKLHVIGGASTIIANRFGGSPEVVLRRAEGTEPTPVLTQTSGTHLGGLYYQGYDGTTYQSGASIRAVLDGTGGANDIPGRLEFYTTPDGSAIEQLRLTIKNDGNVGIGNAGSTNRLSVTGSADFSGHLAVGANTGGIDGDIVLSDGITTQAAMLGLKIRETFTNTSGYIQGLDSDVTLNPSGATTTNGFGGRLTARSATGNAQNMPQLAGGGSTAAHMGTGIVTTAMGSSNLVSNRVGGTITNAYAATSAINNRGTGTITNAYVLHASATTNTGGGTISNNYGLYIQDQSAVGSIDSFNLYSAGVTAKNFFGGNVGIGTTTPSAKLQVANTGRILGVYRVNQSDQTAPFTESFAINNDGGGAQGFIYGGRPGGIFPFDGYGETVIQGNPRSGYNNGISFVTGTGTSQAIAVRIDNGKMGIGIAIPSRKLHVEGGDGIRSNPGTSNRWTSDGQWNRAYEQAKDSALLFSTSGTTFGIGQTGDSLFIGYSTANDTSAAVSYRMAIDQSGNVGVGTASPNTALDVAGAVSVRGMAAPAVSPSGQGRIYFDSTANKFKVSEHGGSYGDLVSSSSGFIQGGNSFGATAVLGTNDANNLVLETNNTARLTIGTTGNISVVKNILATEGTIYSQPSFKTHGAVAYSTSTNADADTYQSFTPDSDMYISSVKAMGNSGMSSAYTCIYSDNADTPGQQIGPASTVGAIFGTSGWYNFSFSSPVPVKGGTKYVLRLGTSSSTCTGNGGTYTWHINTADIYSGGRSHISATQDFLFTVEGSVGLIEGAVAYSTSTNADADTYQSFTPDSDMYISSVKAMGNSGMSSAYTCIYSDNADTPGQQIGPASTVGAIFGTSGWYNFSFSSPVPVKGGTKYVLRLGTSSSTCTGNGGTYTWHINTADIYSGGRSHISATQDFLFTVEGRAFISGGLNVNNGLYSSDSQFNIQATGTNKDVVINGGLCIRSTTSCPDVPDGGLRVDTAGSVGDDPGDVYDLAEFYPASEAIEPGEIVSTDVLHPGKVRKSLSPYESVALGVASSTPAIAIEESTFSVGGVRQTDPLKPLVALAGRVPVKVSIENGPIVPGDYITASSIAGVGMKATQGGRVVGMALGTFDGAGIGSVMMFVNSTWYEPDPIELVQPQASDTNGSFANLNVSGEATITNLKVTGTLTVANIVIEGHILGNNDTRGEAIIPAGETEVFVRFATSYETTPFAVATPVNGFVAGFRAEVDKDKLTIYMDSPAQQDIKFNYFVQQ